jgi:hypothetical protein
MIIIGLLLAVFLVGGTAYLAGKAIKAAQEAGKLTATPKTGSKKARAKVTARNAPHNVRTIFAQAYADNWTAKRAHAREQQAAAPPKPPRRSLAQRLVFPGAVPADGGLSAPATAVAAPAAGTNGHRAGTPTPSAPAPATAARPAARPRLVPVPSPTNGRPAMSSAPPSAAPTGAAADMFSAANILNGHAKAGGIHGKLRATRVYEEAYAHLEAGLQELARDMQENGQYPAMVWEPVMAAAAHVKADSQAMGESANATTSLMSMPVGELAASPVRAPHHDELNRA